MKVIATEKPLVPFRLRSCSSLDLSLECLQDSEVMPVNREVGGSTRSSLLGKTVPTLRASSRTETGVSTGQTYRDPGDVKEVGFGLEPGREGGAGAQLRAVAYPVISGGNPPGWASRLGSRPAATGTQC
ncbi:uncharacterized protein VSU04_013206 [Chlamydotis macqueenii]